MDVHFISMTYWYNKMIMKEGRKKEFNKITYKILLITKFLLILFKIINKENIIILQYKEKKKQIEN